MTYYPRRNRLDLMHPAEKAIQNAVWEIEKMEANVELTNAQILLQQAKDKVSDFLDVKETKIKGEDQLLSPDDLHEQSINDLGEGFGESEKLTVADYEESFESHKKLVRELDIMINGQKGAAKQASLCDIVAQFPKWKATQLQGWISVEERLPELDPPYYDKELKLNIKPLCKQVLIFNGDNVVEGHYWPEKKIFSSYFFNEEEVTHWQPLPAPPSKKEDNS